MQEHLIKTRPYASSLPSLTSNIKSNHHNLEQYNKLLHTFRKTPSVNTRTDIISALSHATSPSLIQRTISLVNSPEIQSLNERISAFAALSTHRNGIFALWEWLKENWDELVEKEGGILGGAFVGSCVQGFTTREQVREVEGFLKGKKGSAEVSSDLVLLEKWVVLIGV
jgi:aminopeptidase 2